MNPWALEDPGNPHSYTMEGVDTNDTTGLRSCRAGNIFGETMHTAYLQVGNNNDLIIEMIVMFSG